MVICFGTIPFICYLPTWCWHLPPTIHPTSTKLFFINNNSAIKHHQVDHSSHHRTEILMFATVGVLCAISLLSLFTYRNQQHWSAHRIMDLIGAFNVAVPLPTKSYHRHQLLLLDIPHQYKLYPITQIFLLLTPVQKTNSYFFQQSSRQLTSSKGHYTRCKICA